MKKILKLVFILVCVVIISSCKPKINYVDDEEHDFTNWIDGVSKTCTEDGTLGHFHCNHCNQDFDEFHNPLYSLVDKCTGHRYVKTNRVEPTGHTTGNIEYYRCSVCHKYFSTNDASAVELQVKDLELPCKTLSIKELKEEKPVEYVVNIRAVVIGITTNTDGGHIYYVLKDLDSNEQICMRNLKESDLIYGGTPRSCYTGYSYAPNNPLPIGAIVEIPVMYSMNDGKGGERYKEFLFWYGDDYADAVGYGTMLEWKAKYIVGMADDYAIDKTTVTKTISSQDDLRNLLLNQYGFQNETICFEGTTNNPLKFVTGAKQEAVGDINREYLYFYYGNESSLKDIAFNSANPVFSNFGNTFNMISPLSCLLCNQTTYEDIDFTKPYEFVGKIYATCVGGNSSYYHFVVMSEDDIINTGNTGSHAVIQSKMAKNAFYSYMENYAASLGIDLHGDITTAVGTTNVITTSDLCRIGIAGIRCEMLQDVWRDLTYDTVIKDPIGNDRNVHVEHGPLNNATCKELIQSKYTVLGAKGGSLNYTNEYREYIHNMLMVVEGPNDTYLVGAVANVGMEASNYTYPNLRRLFDILAGKVKGEDTSALERQMDCNYCAGVALPKSGWAEDGYDWFSDDSIYPHFTKDAETQITTASCWKTMTAITCLSYITQEQLKNTVYVGSTELNSIASTPTFYGGEIVTFEDALHFMMLPSSNVAPNVIARGVGELILRARLAELGIN